MNISLISYFLNQSSNTLRLDCLKFLKSRTLLVNSLFNLLKISYLDVTDSWEIKKKNDAIWQLSALDDTSYSLTFPLNGRPTSFLQP